MGTNKIRETALNAPNRKFALTYLDSKYVFGNLIEAEYKKIKKEIYLEWKKK